MPTFAYRPAMTCFRRLPFLASFVTVFLPFRAVAEPSLHQPPTSKLMPRVSLLPYSPRPLAANPVIDQKTFFRLIDEVAALYDYDHDIHGKDSLVIDKDWENPIANAEAWQGIFKQKRSWGIKIWGGLARVEGMTEDALSLIVCHEFGHHFGGGNMGYTGQFQVRLQTEGGSDYYAAGTCAKRLWVSKIEENRRIRQKAWNSQALAPAVRKCTLAYSQENAQNICIRTMAAALVVATEYFHVYDPRADTPPSLNHRDKSQPDITLGTEAYVEAYPSPQCRLDLYFAGALCAKEVPRQVIPGWDLYEDSWPKTDRSLYEEDQAMLEYACAKGEMQPRPRCYWLKKLPPEERR